MRSVVSGLVLGMMVMSAPAFAGDEELFLGLIPGQPLSEDELAGIYGRGIDLSFECSTGSGCNLNNAGSDDDLTNVVGTLSANSGITSNQQWTGDNNTVSVNVSITVNLNTVSIENSAGAMIDVQQSLDFGGGIGPAVNLGP